MASRQVLRSRRRMKRMVLTSALSLLTSALAALTVAYAVNGDQFLSKPLPAPSMLVLAAGIWFSLKEVVSAYTFYLFARLVETGGAQVRAPAAPTATRAAAPIPAPAAPVAQVPKPVRTPVSVAAKTRKVPLLSRAKKVEAAPAPVTPTPPAPVAITKKTCPFCGRELPYGDVHVICPFCGRRLK